MVQCVHRHQGNTARDVFQGWREASEPGVQEIRKYVASDGLVGGQGPDFAEASGLLGDVGRRVT